MAHNSQHLHNRPWELRWTECFGALTMVAVGASAFAAMAQKIDGALIAAGAALVLAATTFAPAVHLGTLFRRIPASGLAPAAPSAVIPGDLLQATVPLTVAPASLRLHAQVPAPHLASPNR